MNRKTKACWNFRRVPIKSKYTFDYLPLYLCWCGNHDLEGRVSTQFPPVLQPVPAALLTPEQLLTLWGGKERAYRSRSSANYAKQVGASKCAAGSKLNSLTVFFTNPKEPSIPQRGFPKKVYTSLSKTRARPWTQTSHYIHKQQVIEHSCPAGLIIHGRGRLLFPKAESHHNSMSGCHSIHITWELGRNPESWVPLWNLQFEGSLDDAKHI